MAHKVNVVQVLKKINTANESEMVTDPVCGRELQRKLSRYMLFGITDTYYFCSKECQQKFRTPAQPLYRAKSA